MVWTLLGWAPAMVAWRSAMAMVAGSSMAVVAATIMVKSTARRPYPIPHATPAIIVAIRLVIIDAVSNSTTDGVIGPAIPSIGNTAT